MNTLTCFSNAFRRLLLLRNYLLWTGWLIVSGCDLAVIEPNDGKLLSDFTFQVQDPNCNANCSVSFTNTSQNATTYEWDFGDASAVSTLANPVHVYATPGAYPVTLRAFNDSTQQDTTLTVYINQTPVTTEWKAFQHTVGDGMVQAESPQLTMIDNALTNNKPTKIIIVTPVLGKRNTSALGVYYWGAKWGIFNQNLSSLQEGEKFNVITADAGSNNAFVHEITAANKRQIHVSTMDHPLLNNHPNARVFVTPVWEKSSDYVTWPLGVVYVNNRWEIMHLHQAELPANLKVNVIISEQSNSYTHTCTFESIVGDYSKLDHTLTNNKPTALVFTTFNQGSEITWPVPNDLPTGLWYGPNANWSIYNQSGDTMGQDRKYNVLVVQ
jgi:PKD repeat protein